MDASLWLQIETKVRSLVKELIEPTIRRAVETARQLEQANKIQNSIVFKVEDMDQALINTEKKLSAIDAFAKKVIEFEGTQNIMEARFNKDREQLRSEITGFAQKQTNFDENLEVLHHQRDAIKNDIFLTQQTIIANKTELEKKISAFQTMHKELISSVDNKFLLIDVAQNQFSNSFQAVCKDLVKTDSIAKDAQRLTTENIKANKQLMQKILVVKEESVKEIEKTKSLCYSNFTEIQKNMKEIKKLENLIKTDESSIKNELLITDPLYFIIKDINILKDLANYDLSRLEKLEINKYSEEIKNLTEIIREKSKKIIETPLPDPVLSKKKSSSNTSSKKRKRKQRKALKKKIAKNIQKT